MRLKSWVLCIATIAAVPGWAAAQTETDETRTTAAGVFTAAQAKAGGDIYAGLCTSCHTVSSHTGVAFQKSWIGMPVSELFNYLNQSMPEDAPGSLSADEYVRVIAYLLEMNDMPAGTTDLPVDQAALRLIRIDTVGSIPRPTPSRI
jgi:mono/diheme cytochrome c family protein